MPVAFDRVYLHSAGYFLPGEPVDNDAMDQYIAPLNRISGRIKNRILAENGIRQRYYAIDPEGRTALEQCAAGRAEPSRPAWSARRRRPVEVSLLASGSSGGDTLMPGFANMIQGELSSRAARDPVRARHLRSGPAWAPSRRPQGIEAARTGARWRWPASCLRAPPPDAHFCEAARRKRPFPPAR